MTEAGAAAGLRPLRPDDVEEAGRLFETGMDPPPWGWSDDMRRWARTRVHLSLESDPDGCWAAAAGDGRPGLVGCAVAVKRDGIWVLSLLVVDRDGQSAGLGRALMQRALAYGEDCHGALLAASTDPRALRLYGTSGFALRPALEGSGPIDRALLPRITGVRAGDEADLELASAIDAAVRGGRRPRDLQVLMGRGGRFLVSEARAGRGYAIGRDGHCLVLAAESEETARALLWSVLSDTPEDGRGIVQWMTGRQQWALDVALAARLELGLGGAVCTRGRLGPMHPWLPNGALL